MASTARIFQDMLNEYLTLDLLEAEITKRMYYMQQVQKDQTWRSGTLPVPFKGGHASSFSYGKLTGTSAISQDKFVRGEVTTQKELWGAMQFAARDLQEHSGGTGVNEQSFLRVLPDTLESFMNRMKEVASVNFLVGSHFATLTADANANDGLTIVDHPERYTIDQLVVVKDSVNTVTGYVARDDGIVIDTKTIKLVTTLGGVTVVDFSATPVLVANGAKAYVDGADTDAFSGLPEQLLSAANGGSANLFGVEKKDYPFTQATNIDGSAINATDILDDIFDAWTNVKKLGRGTGRQDCVMDYTNLGAVMKKLQLDSGPFRFTSSKADLFGWTTLKIIGVSGELSIVAVHEADFDKIMFLDWGGIKLYSNGLFAIQESPDGLKYFTERDATNGYKYIVDTKLFGENVCYMPSSQGIIHSVPDLTP
jgi:hypothetical protein